MDISWEPGEQIDVSPLGLLTAQIMEQISERYGSEARLTTAAVIVEIDGGGDSTEILCACSDDRPWVQLAFLAEGKISVERLLDQMERAAEDDE